MMNTVDMTRWWSALMANSPVTSRALAQVVDAPHAVVEDWLSRLETEGLTARLPATDGVDERWVWTDMPATRFAETRPTTLFDGLD